MTRSTNSNLLFLLLVAMSLLMACNPDCETYAGIDAEIDTMIKPAGSEMWITTQPIDLLAGRDIYLQQSSAGGVQAKLLESRYLENIGIIAKLPDDVTGNASLYVEDPDCGGQIPLSSLDIKEQSFFVNNPLYITPAPPLMVIPNPPVAPPANIFNAWFSPNNTEYCIWFQPDSIDIPDGNGGMIRVESTQLVPGDITTSPMPGNGSSLEFSAGCNGSQDDDLFHNNSVTGVIDKFNNFIRFQIDRTPKGLGVEEFVGEFIDYSQLPGGYEISSACSGDDKEKRSFMLLTSQTTGRQLILFRNE